MASAKPELLIRSVAIGEAARLAAFMRSLFLEAHPDCSSPANVQSCVDAAFGVDRQTAELAAADRRTWVVEQDGAWLGFAQMRFPAPAPEGVDLLRPAQLHRIYLARAAIGRGLGSRLLATVRDAAGAAGADGLWLSVWQRAPGPIAVYQRHGFSIVGIAVFQVGDEPLLDWIMQSRFTPPPAKS